jgi:hypothetical protein
MYSAERSSAVVATDPDAPSVPVPPASDAEAMTTETAAPLVPTPGTYARKDLRADGE